MQKLIFIMKYQNGWEFLFSMIKLHFRSIRQMANRRRRGNTILSKKWFIAELYWTSPIIEWWKTQEWEFSK